jgi:hypothetical protein
MRIKRLLVVWILLSVFIVLLSEGEDTQGGQLYYITGLVQSASSGRPMPSLWVLIYEGETVRGRSLTGDDGKYLIGALDSKEYKLVVKRGKATLFAEKVRLPQNERYNIRVSE